MNFNYVFYVVFPHVIWSWWVSFYYGCISDDSGLLIPGAFLMNWRHACKFTSAVLNTSTSEVNLPASLPVSEALRPWQLGMNGCCAGQKFDSGEIAAQILYIVTWQGAKVRAPAGKYRIPKITFIPSYSSARIILGLVIQSYSSARIILALEYDRMALNMTEWR